MLAISLAGASMLASGTAVAQEFFPERDISLQDAFLGMQNQTLVMIDVRTEGEWARSGIASGAIPISMTDPMFLEKLAQVQRQNPDKAVAFICASGVRSTVVQKRLSELGYTNIFSVYGGTTGSRNSPGWIGAGLPVSQWP